MRHEVHGRRHLRLRGRPSAPNACNLQTFKSMRSHGHSAAFGRLARPQATHTHTHTRSERVLRTPSFSAVSAPRCWRKLSAISPPSRGAFCLSINLSRPRTVAEFSDLSVGGGSSSSASSLLQIRKLGGESGMSLRSRLNTGARELAAHQDPISDKWKADS